MIRGGFFIWKHIIETMLEFRRETDLLAILKRLLRTKLSPTVSTMGLEPMQWFADQLLNAESLDKLILLSADPVYHSLLGIPFLRL